MSRISAALHNGRRLIVADATRWVRPQHYADPSEISLAALAKLLYRHPALRAVTWLRVGSTLRTIGLPGVPGWVQRRLLRLYGLEIAVGASVGGGLYIAHPVGCVLHAEFIGDNVTVISNATFGTRTDARWPTIGDRVFIGAGARILGGITIGADAKIGANAVVVHNVTSGATAIGIPAKTVR